MMTFKPGIRSFDVVVCCCAASDLARDLAPAIRIAREGFNLDSHFVEFTALEDASAATEDVRFGSMVFQHQLPA